MGMVHAIIASMAPSIVTSPINLEQHAELCVQFRRDAMVCSFADGAARFEAESGPNGEKYIKWLKKRIAEFPEGCVHIALDDQIVGQIEINLRGQQTLGYINLVYLKEEVRGTGLSDYLHDYIVQIFQQVGVVKAQLSVSPTNLRAVTFYHKHGWQDLGPHPGQAEVNLMELAIAPLA